MKRRMGIILLSLLLAGCTAAKAENFIPEKPPAIDMNKDGAGYDKFLQEYPSPEEFKGKLWEFGAETFRDFVHEDKRNENYSPVSLYYALGMTAAGANGQTQKEILSYLKADNKEKLGQDIGTMYRWFYVNTKSDFNLSNSLWIDNKVPWEPEPKYLEDLKQYYFASLHHGNLATEESAKEISEWIKKETDGHLAPKFEPATPDTVMKLINVIYFKGMWTEPFLTNLTEEKEFTLANGEKIQVPMMKQSYEDIFLTTPEYIRGEKSFQDGKMIFVLPKEGSDPWTLVKDKEKFYEALCGKTQEEVHGVIHLELPKFDYKSDYMMTEKIAKKMPLPFGGEADFTAMGFKNSLISSVFQGTRITVNEEGAKASAFTEADMEKMAETQPEEPKELIFKLNRPFIFALQYKGVPLFMGIVANPTQE